MEFPMKNVLCALLLFTVTGCFNHTATLPVFAALPEPEVKLQSLPAMLRGDYAYKFLFSAQAPDGGKIASVKVYFSKEHGDFNELDLIVFEDSFTWTTPKADIPVAQLKIIAKNSAGQATETLSNEFAIRASGPRLLMDSNSEIYTRISNTTIAGSCENGFDVVISQGSGDSATFDTIVPCENGRFSVNVSGGAEGTKEFVIRQTDQVGHTSESPVKWTIDVTNPVIDTYLVNNGANESSTNFLPVALHATDNRSNVTAFCVKYNDSVKPALNDDCWEAPQSIDANKVTGAVLEFDNYFKRVGYGKLTYHINTWVRDGAGNISAMSTDDVLYTPHDPPTVLNVYATNNPGEGYPVRSRTLVDPSQPVYIQWNATADAGENPKIALYYTTDGENFTEIIPETPNAKSGFCNSYTNVTGCFVWNNPFPNVAGARQFFRIRVAAKDSIGSTTYGISNLVNSENLQLLAGNTELGLGGTATAAIFNPFNDHSLAVHPDGRIFVLDTRGLMMVSPKDGVQNLIIRGFSGNSRNGETLPNSFATCATCANLRSPSYLTMEINTGNLLIMDYDRIVRLKTNVTPMVLETVIGGGEITDLDTLVNPLDVKINLPGSTDYHFISPLPNGDILFYAENYRKTPAEGAVMRRYIAAQNKVKTIRFTGIAPSLMGVANTDTTTCPLYRSMFTFNPNNSAITKFMNLYAANSMKPNPGCQWYNPLGLNYNAAEFQGYAFFNPSTFATTTQAAPPQLFPEYDNKLYWAEALAFKFTTGLDGRLYAHGNLASGRGIRRIHVYDEAKNIWKKVVGQDNSGNCEDGSPADDTCRIEPTSVFVSKQHNIYFIDRNQVRTIQDDGTILTLAGAPRATPDNGTVAPQNARFGKITSLQMYKTPAGADRIVLLDQSSFKISEFGDGTPVMNRAGNGNEATIAEIQAAPGIVAAGNPLTWGVDNVSPHMAVDSTNGDIYTIRLQGGQPYRIRRDTGVWEAFNNKSSGGYGPHIQAYQGGKLLVGTNSYCNVRSDSTSSGGCDGRFLLYEGSNATKIMGRASTTASYLAEYCAANQNLLDCGGAGGNTQAGNATQVVSDGWLIKRQHSTTEKRIMKIPFTSGQIQVFATLRNNVLGGFAWDSVGRNVYYCDSASRMVRHSVPASGTEPLTDTVVTMPSAKFKCDQYGSMVYAPNRGPNGSIVFGYTLNGRPGIAEYLIP